MAVNQHARPPVALHPALDVGPHPLGQSDGTVIAFVDATRDLIPTKGIVSVGAGSNGSLVRISAAFEPIHHQPANLRRRPPFGIPEANLSAIGASRLFFYRPEAI